MICVSSEMSMMKEKGYAQLQLVNAIDKCPAVTERKALWKRLR